MMRLKCLFNLQNIIIKIIIKNQSINIYNLINKYIKHLNIIR